METENIFSNIKHRILGVIRYGDSLLIKISLFIAAIFITVALMPKNYSFKYDINKGQPWKYEDLSAPFDFALKKNEEQLRSEREHIRQTNRLYFRHNDSTLTQVLKRYKDNAPSVLSFEEEETDRLNGRISSIIKSIMDRGIVSDASAAVIRTPNEIVSIVKNSGEEREIIFSEIYTIKKATNTFTDKISKLGLTSASVESLTELFNAIISPNVLYDADITDTALNERLEAISPYYGFIPRGKHIISQDEPITEHTYVVLSSLRDVYSAQTGKSWVSWWGYLIITAAIYSMLFWLLTRFKRGRYFHTNSIAMILSNIIMSVAMCYVVTIFDGDLIYVVPICMQTILLRSFLNARVAYMSHLSAVMLCSFLSPNIYMFILVWGITGISCAFSENDIYHRSKLFLSVARITLISIIVAVGVMLIQNSATWTSVLTMCGYLLISGVLMLFAQPLIYVYEKCFGMVSDISLLELTDTNSPLLRLLSQKAPGTFQHSLSVANIAEQAAREMGTNALLVRVAALYHDVGKLKNPSMFIENQSPHFNPHDNLPPEESARVIKAHVSDGLELAKKYGVPSVVSNFMRTHHGKSLVFYFYKKACDMYGKENVNEEDYRYSYEKPSTKNEAILMICDSVEAACRSLKTITEKTLTDLISSVVARQMADGQFDNAEISYKEINRLKTILIEKMKEVYHSRIEYQKD
jgi:putative nucleotidyltransferase with HDIG domain